MSAGWPWHPSRRNDQGAPPFRCLSEGNHGLRQAFHAAHGGVGGRGFHLPRVPCCVVWINPVGEEGTNEPWGFTFKSAYFVAPEYYSEIMKNCSNLMMDCPVSSCCGILLSFIQTKQSWLCQGSLPDLADAIPMGTAGNVHLIHVCISLSPLHILYIQIFLIGK